VFAHVLKQAADIPDDELLDWGPVSEPIATPVSHTRGRLLHRDADGGNESGIWVCTPGKWRCVVEHDEFCHFLSGCCIYTGDSGDRFEVNGGDVAFFPAGWSGTCEVVDTVRKTYTIR